MRRREENRGRRGAARGLLALLLVAGVWLALLGAVLGGTSHASAAGLLAASTPVPSPDVTPPTLPPLGTATPTKTPGQPPTRTPAASPSPSGSPTATTLPTATTPPDNGGGGGGGGDVGPQPTKVVFTQPTAGAGGGGPLGGFSPTTFGSNGLLLATTSSCIVSLLGLIIAAIALSVLLRGGYGPFLRALLHGRRVGLARDKPATASRFGFGPGESFGRTRDGFSGEPRPSRQSGFDYDQYDQRGPRQPGASRPAGRTPPPPGRGSRPNWQ